MNFKSLLSAIGEKFVAELQLNIKNQIDIQGIRFTPVKDSTVKARRSSGSVGKGKKKKNIAGNPPNTRLLYTGKFWRSAFQYHADESSLTIYISDEIYPATQKSQPVSFAQIVLWNNKDSVDVNKSCDNPPLIFPHNAEQIELMQSWEFALEQFNQNISADVIQATDFGNSNTVFELNM